MGTLHLRYYLTLTLAILTSGPRLSSGGFIDAIGEFVPEVSAVCATLASVPSMPKCIDEFTKDLEQWSSSTSSSSTSTINEYGQRSTEVTNAKVPAFGLCCAVNKLQACILQDVKSICGKNADKVAKAATKLALKGVKFLANQLASNNGNGGQIDCDWDEWYYDKASPLCWPFGGQLLGGVALLLLLLLLSCCCCCCCCCCRVKGRTRPVQVFIPCSSNQLFPQRQNPPYRQFDKTEV